MKGFHLKDPGKIPEVLPEQEVETHEYRKAPTMKQIEVRDPRRGSVVVDRIELLTEE